MWKQRLENLKMCRPEGHLLDIGCGEGTFLALAQKKGWEIGGTEVSEYAAGYASDLLKIDIFNGGLPEAGFEENTFDVVTMWHVLEHVQNPMSYLSEIRKILKPEGLFILAVPNVENRVFQIAYRFIKGRKMKLFTRREKEIHLYHFSSKTVKDYLKRAGFDCVKLSPDFGIIDVPKKMINWFSVIFYYLFRIHVYDAMEIYAVPRKNLNLT
jgi:2-polyprenyl-3-methyl-5-hydroxy-6-metoxy-1,4-benzoquinol methylase